MCAKKQTMWGAHSLLGRCLALPFHSFPGIGSMSVPAKGDSCLSGSMYFEWLKLTASGALKLLWDKVHVLAWGHVCSVGPWSWGPWLSLIGPLQGGDHVSHELGPCSELSWLAQAALPDSFLHFHSSASGWDPWVQDFRGGFHGKGDKALKDLSTVPVVPTRDSDFEILQPGSQHWLISSSSRTAGWNNTGDPDNLTFREAADNFAVCPCLSGSRWLSRSRLG